ncbi:MAG: hypothetical protein KJ063_23150 [Anaerolineae bacterium]|nr:hypothetical protein [Anaerolineae bacterium]
MERLLTTLLWFLLSLPLVLLTQRWIHRHLHGVALLLTGKPGWALLLYSLILFPGVLLHELSHWLAAKLLGVRTAGISLLPKMGKDGAVQLGYVEYYKTPDVGSVRESLIGGAPLLTGAAAILIIAYNIFDLPSLVYLWPSLDLTDFLLSLQSLFYINDFLLWLYLFFAISNAMMPSASDRRAWPTFFLILAAVFLLIYLLGLAEFIFTGLLLPATAFFSYLALAFSLTILVNLVFILFIGGVEWLLGQLFGAELIYRRPGQK